MVILPMFACTIKVFSQNIENPQYPVKIGFLIQESRYEAAVQGAEMAVMNANEKSGLNGQHFELVVRSMEGPWGTGSKQAVDLIFEERVWALLGVHDGRNAHLVEQAAAKSEVVFLSAWSGDPTLSQAFVPWFFNCVPNDNQQAASLISEIYNNRKFRKVAVIHGNDYDSKMMLNSFTKSAVKQGESGPLLFDYENYSERMEILTGKLREESADCIVLFCPPAASLKIIRQIKKTGLNLPVYGSLNILNENELSAPQLQEFDNLLMIPSGEWPETEKLKFMKDYEKEYGNLPGLAASYSYDCVKIITEAINEAGSSDREKIQKSLEKIGHKGITGFVQFDERGNRSGNFRIMKTKDGLPVSLD
jgi:branched-chain amino acid transport system substrate-binding protein